MEKQDELIEKFHVKITSQNINNKNDFDEEIISHYRDILKLLSKDFKTYRKYSPYVLSTLEENNKKAISYSIFVFFELFDKIIETKTFRKLDQSIFKTEISDTSNSKFIKLVEESLKLNNQLRISEFEFPPNNLTKQEIKEIISMQTSLIQESSRILNWTVEQSDNVMFQLPILRHLLVKIDKPELFYYVVGIFLDRLNTSEYFQAARDVAEEILIASFKDKLQGHGFFNAFRCYSTQNSAHTSLLYANLSMFVELQNEENISDKYLQELIWQSIKSFRNTGLHYWAIKIYESIPKNLHFSEYQRRSIDHTYFTCLILNEESNLPNLILDYLNKERESIFTAGEFESAPWLITLYNIKRIYPDSNFSNTGLGFYINVFEKIVPSSTVSRYKDIIEGDSLILKDQLKQSLVKLNETRNKSDIVYDNHMALKIANRLIEDSFDKNDAEAILLAMMLKSDFSLIFKSKEVAEFAPFKLPSDEIKGFNKIYNNRNEIQQNISNNKFQLNIWLAVTEGKVFQLSLKDKLFKFDELKKWEWSKYRELSKTEYFSNLVFDDTIKDKGGVREIFEEEHLEHSENIKKEILFCKLNVEPDSQNIYLVKDMDLANFPHNLFLNQNNEYIHLKKPITNILSTEWYLSSKSDYKIDNNFTKSIWIPTQEGDFTLNHLFSKLEKTLTTNNYKIHTNKITESSISSDINIICSHGAKDIATKQIIYPNENPLYNLDKIIGKGKVLIFFVCHSGSYESEMFRNNITSLVKTYISKGYKAVIAPFWALHINVPEIWLPKFMESINKGKSIDIALYEANKKVNSKYPTPSAWASMHLYGNPHLIVD